MRRATWTYPVDEETQRALSEVPRLQRILSLAPGGRSELEIARYLNNRHNKYSAQLLKAIDEEVDSAGSIGLRLVQQTSPVDFLQTCAEFFLFRHLRAGLRAGVTAVSPRPGQKAPDIEVVWRKRRLWIEVFSPFGYYGYQVLFDAVHAMFKYSARPVGFDVELYVGPTDDAPASVDFPLWIVDRDELMTDLVGLARRIDDWLSAGIATGQHLEHRIARDKITARVHVLGLRNDPGSRGISLSSGTYSTDLRQTFEVGLDENQRICNAACSLWGVKLSEKLARRQAGPPEEALLRLLVVDFENDGSGFPDFICWPSIAPVLSGSILLVAQGIHPPKPYDAVIPARLGLDCCFGSPTWLEPSKEAIFGGFASDAGMNTPCRE